MKAKRRSKRFSIPALAGAVLMVSLMCGCTAIDKPGAVYKDVKTSSKAERASHDKACRCTHCRNGGWGRIYAGRSSPGSCATGSRIGLD